MKRQWNNNTPTYMRLSVKITLLLIFFAILTYDVLSWWTALMDEWIYNRIMNSFSPNLTPIFIEKTKFSYAQKTKETALYYLCSIK